MSSVSGNKPHFVWMRDVGDANMTIKPWQTFGFCLGYLEVLDDGGYQQKDLHLAETTSGAHSGTCVDNIKLIRLEVFDNHVSMTNNREQAISKNLMVKKKT